MGQGVPGCVLAGRLRGSWRRRLGRAVRADSGSPAVGTQAAFTLYWGGVHGDIGSVIRRTRYVYLLADILSKHGADAILPMNNVDLPSPGFTPIEGFFSSLCSERT